MNSPRRYRATYNFAPIDHLIRREFYIWGEAIERWKTEGLPADYNERNLFNFDPPGNAAVGFEMGWCEPPFIPAYEEKTVEDEGDTEIIQDFAGRWLRVFKGRRHGFMPDYIKHPVSNMKDWRDDVQPRLDPEGTRRFNGLEAKCSAAATAARNEGKMTCQGLIGGYMYLRALMGPEDLLYAVHDQPELIHAMMQHWTKLMDTCIERIQRHVHVDELALAEDICYNHGLLISPDMVREFLLPYYQEVAGKARARQRQRMFMTVDTDGWVVPAIPLYIEAGMDSMTPFEVASGCDVVQIGRNYPDLVLAGGIDKRVLAAGKDAIDKHLEYIIPAMVERGGYIPTCDHGVPDDVSFENYMHYRRRICELDHK